MNEDSRPTSWLDRPVVRGLGLTWEQGLYLLIIALCLVSRLAMLGYRVESHDESLHVRYSWDLYVGNGYQHNPMMHGPFLFHATALCYFLFGDSDFTARLHVALLGTVLVAFPYLLRRYLGRGGALFASLLLLISPSITYYSRYIRHDIVCDLWALFVIWAAFRYLEEGRSRHFYLLAAAFSLMYATHEIAFIYTAIIGLFLLGMFAAQAARRRWERGNLWGQLRSLRSFDLIVLIGTLTLPFASPLAIHLGIRIAALVVGRYPDPMWAPAFWVSLANVQVLDYTNTAGLSYSATILALTILIAIAIGLLWDWRRWLVAAAIYLAIFLFFFTTIFTNGAGIASGWIGSLAYWLAQQGVERGNQPWFYYLVILPLYDFLPLLGALAAAGVWLVRGWRGTRGNGQWPMTHEQWSMAAVGFCLFWAVMAWVGFSLAGEKMPWLTVHIALPMILLTGWLLGQVVRVVDWRRVRDRHGWLLALLLPALAAALVTLVTALQRRPFQGVELAQLQVSGNFLGSLVGLAVLGALVGWLWVRIGGRDGLLLTVLTAFLALSLLTVHVAFRLSFINFDRPAEFLVYAHNGPDVRTALEQVEELTARAGGGPEAVDVSYNLGANTYLLYWYLRNNPNARFFGDQPTAEQVRAAVVIAEQALWPAVEPYLGDDYITLEYTHYWWPMEDYRLLTGQRLWDWLRDPQRRAALWQIFYRMDYTLYDALTGKTHQPSHWPLQQHFRMYVRRDVAAQVWDFGVGATETAEQPAADPYATGWIALTARAVWGTSGSAPGQFSAPRAIAVAPDGTVYVADSRNHRIQRFSPDGDFLGAWGSQGDCGAPTLAPATFCEPWGVAVGADGTVYVADTWAHRVQRFSADGQFLGQWGSFGMSALGDPLGQGAFYGPRAVAVAADGTVYVSDTGNKRVQVFSADGAFLREWGGGGSALGQLNEPVGLAVSPAGTLFVADSWNLRVQEMSGDGTPLRAWPIMGWNNPQVEEKPYLAVDEAGRVIVSDPGHYRILVFDANGEYLYSFGQFGFDESSLGLPMGVAVGADGTLYVTDAVNDRVMVFDLP